jgi:hypothetical protein
MSVNQLTRRGKRTKTVESVAKPKDSFILPFNALGLVPNPVYQDAGMFKLVGLHLAILGIWFGELIEILNGNRLKDKFVTNVEKSSDLILSNLMIKIKTDTFLDHVFQDKVGAVFQKISWDDKNSFRSHDELLLEKHLNKPEVFHPNNVLLILNKESSDNDDNDDESFLLWFILVINDDYALECDLKQKFWILANKDYCIENVKKMTTENSTTQIMHHFNPLISRLDCKTFTDGCKKLLAYEKEIIEDIDDFVKCDKN